MTPLGVAVSLMILLGTYGAPARGPLAVCADNPRYFTDGTGRAIYLTGSHTHNNLLDGGTVDPPPAFDYDRYLDLLAAHGHNFIRLWTRELHTWTESDRRVHFNEPMPWRRTGPGTALDGKPRFDLTAFNESYFSRLRSRVIAARRRGIYVSVMLFEGWGLQFAQPPTGATGHPFHRGNNINGVDGDIDGDGRMLEVHTLLPDPRLIAVRTIQEAYVRKVLDTLADLDNVLYEIANESGPYSTAWQYHLIMLIKAYERGRGMPHPVGMTAQYRGGRNAALFQSPADWISPDRVAPPPYNYRTDPPPADGRKVVLLDTDHLGGHWGTLEWVWKSFLRGHNPIFMDLAPPLSHWPPLPEQTLIRRALGHTLAYARRMNLAAMLPSPEVSTTRYALANPGAEYLVFAPGGGAFGVRLPRGRYRFEWFDPATGAVVASGMRVSGGGTTSFLPPFPGHAVLYLRSPGR